MASAETFESEKRGSRLLKSILISVVILVVFRPAFSQPFHALDDVGNIVENEMFRKPVTESFRDIWSGPYLSLYIPVTYSVWRLLAVFTVPDPLTGTVILDPRPFHAANVVLHAMNTVCVFLILVWLFRRELPAFWAALVFGLHPLQAEPVAWVTGLKDVLSGSLVLWGVYSVVRGAVSGGSVSGEDQRFRGAGWWVFATVLYTAALLSKPSAVSFPLMAAALMPILPASRRRRRLWWWTAFWVILAAAVAFLTRSVQPDRGFALVVPFYKRLMIALGVYGFYLGKLFVPVRLAVTYGMDIVSLAARMPVSFVLGGTAVPVLVALLWRFRRYSGYVSAVLLFGAALLPVAGILPFGYQNYSVVADRYAYLSLFGAAVAVAAFLSSHLTKPVLSGAAGVAIVLGILTVHQLSFWNNDIRLLKHAIDVKPDNFFAYLVLSSTYRLQGQMEKADEMFNQALHCRFSDPVVCRELEKLLRDVRRGGKAAEAFPGIKSVMDGSWQMLNDIGVHLMEAGRIAEAKGIFEKAMSLNPAFPEVYLNDGILAMRLGEFDRAIRRFDEAGRLAPEDWRVFSNLGNAYYRMNRLDEAEQAYLRAVKLSPESIIPKVNLANVYMAKGLFDRAEPLLSAVLKQRPDLLVAAVNLGYCYQRRGAYEQAEQAYRRALELDADNLQALSNLAVLCEKTNRREEALNLYRRILKLNPKASAAARAVERLQPDTGLKTQVPE